MEENLVIASSTMIDIAEENNMTIEQAIEFGEKVLKMYNEYVAVNMYVKGVGEGGELDVSSGDDISGNDDNYRE